MSESAKENTDKLAPRFDEREEPEKTMRVPTTRESSESLTLATTTEGRTLPGESGSNPALLPGEGGTNHDVSRGEAVGMTPEWRQNAFAGRQEHHKTAGTAPQAFTPCQNRPETVDRARRVVLSRMDEYLSRVYCEELVDSLIAAVRAEVGSLSDSSQAITEKKICRCHKCLDVCVCDSGASLLPADPSAAPASTVTLPDRDATCDWNCVLPYPHTGPCSDEASAAGSHARRPKGGSATATADTTAKDTA